jgi:hypothetical protein
MTSWFTMLGDQAADLWRYFWHDGEIARLLPMLQPNGPFAGSRALSPFTALGVLIALVVTSGVALGALGLLLAASFVLYFLLTEVLDLTIELQPARS